MTLLFVTGNEELPGIQKALARKKAAEANTGALTTTSFNVAVAREMLKPLPQTLEEDLSMVERVAPLLGTIMNGNPRQCKRFLNTLLLRLQMGRSREIKLRQRVLAKLMLLEYFRAESFRRLAEIQFAQDGSPKELGQMEKAVRQQKLPPEEIEVTQPVPALEIQKKPPIKKIKPPEKIDLSAEFRLWISDPWIQEWLLMEPALADEDLRTYFFFSRDNLGMLGTAGQRLSLAARQVLDKIRSASQALRVGGLKELKQLAEADANAVFEAMVERARREEDLGAETASLASGKHLALVGHYGNTQREQLAAYEALKPIYDLQMLPLWFHLVPPKSSKDQVVELTMRSRSILFLTLGTAVATALPAGTQLYIPENGVISLNVPLTFGRTGTLSTRTTHPHTIALYQKLIEALGISVPLQTPYRFKTKGEMLRDCSDKEMLKSGIYSTMSCSRPQSGRFHGWPVGQHCGYCVPCIIRRAALTAVNLDNEPRIKDVLSADIRANEAAGQDKRPFLMATARLRAMSDLEVTSEILASGPIDVSDLEGLTGVFRRGMKEVDQFLGGKT
jgi:hypothetical protein